MTIEAARFFWCEAGNLSGGSRNQIEFTDETVRFFDEASRKAGRVFIAYNSKVKGYCPLTNRAQDYGQWTDIWRLGLITAAKGGVDYQNKVIGFERRIVGKNFVYVISVVDPGSAEHQEWVRNSGAVGRTFGTDGREFGYFE